MRGKHHLSTVKHVTASYNTGCFSSVGTVKMARDDREIDGEEYTKKFCCSLQKTSKWSGGSLSNMTDS